MRAGVGRWAANRSGSRTLTAAGAAVALALAAFGLISASPATAAPGITASISPQATTTLVGDSTTYTLAITCTVATGCTDAIAHFITGSTTMTGDGMAGNQWSSWFTNNSCPGVTTELLGLDVLMEYGTIPVGTLVCTFTVTPPAGTLNGAVATLAPSISGSNFDAVQPPAATLTVLIGNGLTVSKSTSTATYATFGAHIDYTFTVTNTTTETLTGVGVTDHMTAPAGPAPSAVCTALSNPVGTCSGATTTLAPGQVATFTATYSASQADLDNDEVVDYASVAGTPSSGGTLTGTSNTVTVPGSGAVSIHLIKTADPTSVDAAGQDITYSYLVQNTGVVTMQDIVVVDTSFSGTGPAPVISCPPGITIAPNGSVFCTASYTVTQADMDAGSITNSATAEATPPFSGITAISNQSTATVTVNRIATLSLEKSASPTFTSAPGQDITWSYLVTNTGNQTLTGINVAEQSFSGTGTLGAITCPDTTLAPGASTTCTASYVSTQDDVDSFSVTNTAVASGTPPTGPAVESLPSTALLTTSQTPSVSLTKTASATSVAAVGDDITYTYTVMNTGNTTLGTPSIDETSFSGSDGPLDVSCPSGNMAPDASVNCTADYTVTQADLDSGAISNTATAGAETIHTGIPVTSDPSTIVVSVTQTAALTMTKTASVESVTNVGQAVTYSFLVTNTGNVTLHNVHIDETHFSGTGTLGAITCPNTTLAPTASETCTATYTVTAADLTSGTLTNTAVAGADGPTDATANAASDPSTADVRAVAPTSSPQSSPTASVSATTSTALASTGTPTGSLLRLATLLALAGGLTLLLALRRTGKRG